VITDLPFLWAGEEQEEALTVPRGKLRQSIMAAWAGSLLIGGCLLFGNRVSPERAIAAQEAAQGLLAGLA